MCHCAVFRQNNVTNAPLKPMTFCMAVTYDGTMLRLKTVVWGGAALKILKLTHGKDFGGIQRSYQSNK